MSRLADLVRSAKESAFIKDTAKLSFGTLAGRLISVAVLPLLTRIYSPADFTVLATYLALLTTVAVAACLRFDVAIPLADNDEDAANLFALALAALVTVTLIFLIAILIIPDELTRWLGNPAIKPFLPLIPLGILLAATYSACQYWTTRVHRFGQIARTRVAQSMLGAATNVSLGWLGFGPIGLLLGNALSIGSGGLGLAFEAFRNERDVFAKVSAVRMLDVVRRYGRYPIYSTPDALLNIAGQQLPILIIAAQAGIDAGFLLLATQLMAAPMGLLGTSISQVYMSRATHALRAGQLGALTVSIMKRLAMIGFPAMITVGILAPFLVPIVFGNEWARTGIIIVWMVPWIALQFIASPVSMVMLITGKQKKLLVIRAIGLLIRVGALSLAAVTFAGQYMVEYYAVANALVYALMARIFLTAARGEGKSPMVHDGL